MMKMEWQEENASWGNSECLKLGKFNVGSVYWDAMQNKEKQKYAACCSLPGIKLKLGHYSTASEAKERVERAVSYWLVNAGLLNTQANDTKPL